MIVSDEEYKELIEWLDEDMGDTKRGLKIGEHKTLGTNCGRCGRKAPKILKVEYGTELIGMYKSYLCHECFDELLGFMYA